jgi:hypothetical protein
MTAAEWITAFAAKLGIPPPDEATTEALLALAGTAAHASERTAAPIACFLAGHAGIDPVEAKRLAETLPAETA